MKKNDIITGGLNGLLKPTDGTTNTNPVKDEPKKKADAVVCYRVPAELAENVKYIAHFDRKTLGAVVTEALTAYVEAWKPTNEKPRKL